MTLPQLSIQLTELLHHNPHSGRVKFQLLGKLRKFCLILRSDDEKTAECQSLCEQEPPMSPIAQRLAELKLTLPSAPKPVAAYAPAVRTGNLIFISGQVPFSDGKLVATGPVPSAVTLEAARDAARQCVLNALAVLADQLDGDLDRVKQIVRVGVFVCSDPGFTDQPKVANGASELLQELFGERGRHARAAVGSIALPLGATVEVEMIAEVSD
jgi:enamine deaminase RidA (YjgF/YER057c/UK114 family)